MTRLRKPPKRLDLVRLFADFARAHGLSLRDPGIREAFHAHIDEVLATDATRATVVHGMRTQAMFAFVAHALGGCASITEEDAGDFLGLDATAKQRPDYRIIGVDGEHFFVEVKNHYQKSNGLEPLRMTRPYVEKLEAYAALHGMPLKFAVYWSRWNVWTLVPVSAFTAVGKSLVLTLDQAFTLNEMIALGDYNVGLEAPIIFRLYSDPEKPRAVSASGEASFAISRAAILVNGEEIKSPLERRLAWYFMMFGDWRDTECPCQIENGEILWADFCVSPEERTSDQHFDFIGTASGLASSVYREMTRSGTDVSGIFTDADPVRLCPRVPDGYRGDVLKLWIFRMEPKGARE